MAGPCSSTLGRGYYSHVGTGFPLAQKTAAHAYTQICCKASVTEEGGSHPSGTVEKNLKVIILLLRSLLDEDYLRLERRSAPHFDHIYIYTYHQSPVFNPVFRPMSLLVGPSRYRVALPRAIPTASTYMFHPMSPMSSLCTHTPVGLQRIKQHSQRQSVGVNLVPSGPFGFAAQGELLCDIF